MYDSNVKAVDYPPKFTSDPRVDVPPDWQYPKFQNKEQSKQDWKYYVSQQVAYSWHTFSNFYKIILSKNFQMIAEKNYDK